MKLCTGSSLRVLGVCALTSLFACRDSHPAPERGEEFPPSQARQSQATHTTALGRSGGPPVAPAVVNDTEPAPKVEQASASKPSTYREHMQLGRELSESKDFLGALSEFEAATAKNPASTMPRIQMARMLVTMGRSAEAREHVEAALELDAASSLAWNTMGRVELAESNHEAAQASFERAALENPDNSHAWNNLGYVHLETADYESAAYALEQATTGARPTAYMWNNLGMAYEHLDRISEARAAYRQGVASGSSKAQLNLERLEGVVSLEASGPAKTGKGATDPAAAVAAPITATTEEASVDAAPDETGAELEALD